jgi:hypothetical protein
MKSENKSLMTIIEKLARSKVGEITVGKLEQLASMAGIDEYRLFSLYIDLKNKLYQRMFASTPYSERVLLLPQCLRSRECPARMEDLGYLCTGCGRCHLKEVIAYAEDIGYKGVFIIPGGSIVQKIFSRVKPKACLGVACFKELILGSSLCERLGIIGQGVALLRDGCINTAADWSTVYKVMVLTTH